MIYRVLDPNGRRVGAGLIKVPNWEDETIRQALGKLGGFRGDASLYSLEGEPETLIVYDRGFHVLSLELVACPRCGSFEGCDQECPQKNLN